MVGMSLWMTRAVSECPSEQVLVWELATLERNLSWPSRGVLARVLRTPTTFCTPCRHASTDVSLGTCLFNVFESGSSCRFVWQCFQKQFGATDSGWCTVFAGAFTPHTRHEL